MMLRPNFLDQTAVFHSQLAGMAFLPFTYADFETSIARLVETSQESWKDSERTFLPSFKRGEPDWSLVPLRDLQRLPAIQWKLANIRKLAHQEECLEGNVLNIQQQAQRQGNSFGFNRGELFSLTNGKGDQWLLS